MVFLGLCYQMVEPRLYLLSFYVFSIHSSNTSPRSENMSVRMQRLKNKYVDFNMWLLFLLSWCPAFGLNFNQKALHPRPAEWFSITPKLLIREPKGEMVGVQGPSGYFLFQSPQRPCKAGSLLAAQKETSVMQIWVRLQSSRAGAEAGIRTRVEEVLESLAISRSWICHPQNRPLWDIDYFELCCCCSVAKSCLTLCDPHGLVAHQAPRSMGFSRLEYWSGLPFLSPRDLPDSELEPRSPTLQPDSLLSEPPFAQIHVHGVRDTI